MGSPRVSTVAIFLNAERFLEEAIASVLAQTFTDWELLLVDDGSSDGSSEIAHRYARKDERICYVEHAGHENRGAAASRNAGVQQSRGEFVAFLDSDDVWFPQKLARQISIFDAHPELALVFGASEYWHSWTGNSGDEDRDEIVLPGIRPGEVIEPPLLSKLRLSSRRGSRSLRFEPDDAARGRIASSIRGAVPRHLSALRGSVLPGEVLSSGTGLGQHGMLGSVPPASGLVHVDRGTHRAVPNRERPFPRMVG
jgi:glycosyltransferase involved in cell wall biosynthesis